MPTPVSVARQCLTTDAAIALDEAVTVARRRNHSQTTSLHAIAAILSLPSSSTLRDACGRVRSTTYSSRLQFRALELCFSSALDRLPSSQPQDDPPISNSFMAAIKRSQANQRRHPEAFSFHQQLQLQQQQQQSSSLSCVKVELQQLILSILDDPVVSRVFAEAGFRSCDLKLAILRPPHPISRYPRRPPLFLCNLPGSDSESNRRNFNFPFLGFSENGENCRRIGEILSRKERNPLLVGVSAIEALRSFGEILQSGKGGVVPVEISGVSYISIEKEISSASEGLLGSKFRELDQLMENCSGPGVVIGYGDLKVLVDDASVDVVSFVVAQLTRLSQVHRGKLWLMGVAAEYEMYLKFLMKFPSIEKDWDLQLLPITSVRSSPMEGGFRPQPYSMTESFIPFGGLFCMPSDLKGSLNSTNQSAAPCEKCSVKYEQEVSALLKGGSSLSIADQYRGSLMSWMHNMSECNAEKGLDMAQARDDGTILNAKVNGLQKKWSDICQRLNHCCPGSEAGICRTRPQAFASIVGFPFAAEKEKTDNHSNSSSCSSINAFPEENEHRNILPSMSRGMQWVRASNQKTKPVVYDTKNEDSGSELQVRPSKSEWLLTEHLQFPPCSADSSIPKSHESTSCPTVTTDLGLGTLYATCKEPKRAAFPSPKERLQDFTDCLPSKVDLANPNISKPSFRSSPFSGSNLSSQFDPNDFKSLWTNLSGMIGRQKEAVQAICESIARCRTGNGKRCGARRDIWLSFVGPDRVAKRRIAFALAEMMFGNRESLISVDLSSQDGFTCTKTIFGCQDINDYDEKFRGKVVADFIAEEISKKPLSIVFLENINKADLLLQKSLSHAIKTGKFSDSRGREISVNNVIFLATSESMKDVKCFTAEKVNVNFSEEIICQAQSSEMQILIGSAPEGNIMSNYSSVSITLKKEIFGPVSVNKRKLVSNNDSYEQCDTPEWEKRAHKTTKFLDLNLSIEDREGSDADCGSNDSDSVSQNSEPLLEDFFREVDEIIPFEPFNFDALAQRVIEETTSIFKSTIGPEARLEIDTKVMEQILAAAWLSDRTEAIKDWAEEVLRRSFIEAQQRYALSSRAVLKLVSCEGLHTKEQSAGICLPTKIILN